MKARYTSNCARCGRVLLKGSDMAMLVRQAVHPACKEAHMEEVRSAAKPEVLPEARGWADRSEFLKPRRGRGVPFVPEKKYLDGRGSDGRFVDSSDDLT